MQYTFPADVSPFVDTGIFIRADGTRALTGDWDIGAGRKILADQIGARSTQLILEQTGDEYGASRISIMNRNGYGGAQLENIGLDLMDMGFKTSTGSVNNFRMEHRPGNLIDSLNTNGEFQFIHPIDTVWFASGENATIINTGKVGINTAGPTAKLDINSDIMRLRAAKTPASAGDTGNQGDICWDASYIYVCVATNTWKRAALATW